MDLLISIRRGQLSADRWMVERGCSLEEIGLEGFGVKYDAGVSWGVMPFALKARILNLKLGFPEAVAVDVQARIIRHGVVECTIVHACAHWFIEAAK